jgi:hypothetical protein
MYSTEYTFVQIYSTLYTYHREGNPMSNHSDQIRALLTTYERALNTSDAALAASCYTSDGVFMPTTLPTAAGGSDAGRVRPCVRCDSFARHIHR